MGKTTYSTYEAKTHLSEILRQVRRNERIVITSNGKAVAEVRPFSSDRETPEGRIARLQELGIVEGRSRASKISFPRGEKRHGALRRFLAERE